MCNKNMVEKYSLKLGKKALLVP